MGLAGIDTDNVQRRCSVCGEVKPLVAGFYKNSRGKGGYAPFCKECQKKKSRESEKRRKVYKPELIEFNPPNALTWDYGGKNVTFDPDADWICLTDLWQAMGAPESKKPYYWLRSENGKEHINALAKITVWTKNPFLMFSNRGVNGTTWAYWLLGYRYADYLNPDLGNWVLETHRDYLRGHSIDNPGKSAQLPESGSIDSILVVSNGLEKTLFDGTTIKCAQREGKLIIEIEPDTAKAISKFISPETNGYIYLVQDFAVPTWYKIGCTKNPIKRIPNINGQSNHENKTICQFKTNDMLSLERKLHEYFKSLCIGKEWFELRNDDLMVFERLQREDFIDAEMFNPLDYFSPLVGTQILMGI